MAARSINGNPQLIYAGSAVDQEKHEHGLVFTQLRQRALRGTPRVGFLCWSADVKAWLEAHGIEFDPDRPEIAQVTPEMLDDPRMWAQANPGLGIRISVQHIATERAGALGPREFAVERLGIGDPPVASDVDRVIAKEVFAAISEKDPENRITSSKAFSIDVNPDRTWGSIGVAGLRDDELWQFAVADRRKRTDWIVDRCVELAEDEPGVPFAILGRGPAANLIMDLEAAGLNIVTLDGQEYGYACSDFFDAVDHRTARYPFPQPDLDEALAGARRSQSENAWTWSRKASTSPDISPLVAVTIALWCAQSGESQYTTVIFASDHMPTEEEQRDELGPQAPLIIGPEDYTTCFACQMGGCKIHGGASDA
jgi:hypothetical protein